MLACFGEVWAARCVVSHRIAIWFWAPAGCPRTTVTNIFSSCSIIVGRLPGLHGRLKSSRSAFHPLKVRESNVFLHFWLRKMPLHVSLFKDGKGWTREPWDVRNGWALFDSAVVVFDVL